ncbi:efflux transporter periplasmic adaptor subunit, partial [Paracoccus sp. PXZ]
MTMRLSPGVCAGLVLCCLTAAVPAAAQQLPPPQVSVQEMTPEALPVVNELPGRVAATRTAEVRPRVGGIVIERVFEQG